MVLRTAGGTSDDTAIGPLVNSGTIGNRRTFQANSPSISAGFGGQAVPQFCESWWADSPVDLGVSDGPGFGRMVRL